MSVILVGAYCSATERSPLACLWLEATCVETHQLCLKRSTALGWSCAALNPCLVTVLGFVPFLGAFAKGIAIIASSCHPPFRDFHTTECHENFYLGFLGKCVEEV